MAEVAEGAQLGNELVGQVHPPLGQQHQRLGHGQRVEAEVVAQEGVRSGLRQVETDVGTEEIGEGPEPPGLVPVPIRAVRTGP